MSIVDEALKIAQHASNGDKPYFLAVVTSSGRLHRGEPIEYDGSTLRLSAYGYQQDRMKATALGTDLFIAEAHIESIEIVWRD